MTKYIIIIVILAIIILSSVLFFRSMSSKPRPSPTPATQSQQDILSVSPANNSIDIGTFAEITIKFTKPVSSADQTKVKLEANPTIDGSTTWSADGITLSFIPQPSLKINQKYELKLTYPGGVYGWLFETASKEITSTEDQIKSQEGADRYFAEWQKQVNQTYPWLNRLPLQTNDYYAYFDIDDKKFYADIFKTADEKKAKKEIETILRNITGSDFDKYPTEYIIK